MKEVSIDPGNARKKILLVEDEALVAMAESDELRKNGFDVTIIQTGEEAIDIIKTDSSFDLVLMDIGLGKGIDGIEASRQILSFKKIPIIFLTVHSEPELYEKVNGIEGVANYGYIIKESDYFVLISAIKQTFEDESSESSELTGYFYR